jgi:hypothetical protein
MNDVARRPYSVWVWLGIVSVFVALLFAGLVLLHALVVMLLGQQSSPWVWLALIAVGVFGLALVFRQAQRRALHREEEQVILDYLAERLREQH